MLDFNQLVRFITLLLVLLTLVLVANFSCNKIKKPDVISNTIFKRDTITIYKYGAGTAQKVIRQVLHFRDTVILRDTSIRFSDSNINLLVTNPCGDTPFVEYRIKERTIIDSIIIKAPKRNTFNLGMIASKSNFTPALGYSTQNCNYFIGYDVINKTPSFGIMVNLSNIARPKD
jgi:hypothetical protein